MTFYNLINDYSIIIPIIQRDYVQGCDEKILEHFINDIFASLKNKSTLDLNFIYGEVRNGKEFYPVDGQQRLTTLFLLHIFAFKDDENKKYLLKKFLFVQRASALKFFTSLIDDCKNVFNEKPSDYITKKANWFRTVWQNDLTVVSAIKTLDKIYDKYNEVKVDLSLLAQDDCPIKFQFLNVCNLGNIDNLYIKLNARGRALTKFEIFKAQMLKYLKNEPNYDKFAKNLDTTWLDLFWKYFNKNDKDLDEDNDGKNASTDDALLQFFGNILKALSEQNEIDLLDVDWFDKFDFDDKNKESLLIAFKTLEIIEKDDEIRQFLFSKIHSDEDGNITMTYKDIVCFYAICAYIKKYRNLNLNFFHDWLRVIKNLTNNDYKNKIDSPEKVKNANSFINTMVEAGDDIIKVLAEKSFIPKTFDERLFNEEVSKAKIIYIERQNKSNEKTNKILSAEKHPYFTGQIGLFLVNFLQNDENKFVEYFRVISALFNKKGNIFKDQLFRCSLLSVGDYTLKISGAKTLCQDDKLQASKTPSFKQLFDELGITESGKILKSFLDSILQNTKVKNYLAQLGGSEINLVYDKNFQEKLSEALREILENNKLNIGIQDWRYCFINYPELFDKFDGTAHYRLKTMEFFNSKNHYELCIIPKCYTNGYNKNLYLIALGKALGLSDDKYCTVKGEKVERYLLVEKKQKAYRIYFRGEKSDQNTDNLINGTFIVTENKKGTKSRSVQNKSLSNAEQNTNAGLKTQQELEIVKEIKLTDINDLSDVLSKI